MRKIWYDVSEIVSWQGHYTGIQRVVFMIGERLAKDQHYEVRYCRYDRPTNRYTEVNFHFQEQRYEPRPSVKKKPAKQPLHVQARIFALGFIPNHAKTLVKKSAKLVFRTLKPVKPIKFTNEDTVIVAGAFWTGSLGVLASAKQAAPKLMIIGVMYDLVPLIVPQYATDVTVIDYKKTIRKALKTYDKWLSISENTKKDFLNYARQQKVQLNAQDIEVIRLGSDINIKGDVKPLVVKGKQPTDFVLCVGTLEPRKNQYLLYQAVKYAEEKGVKLPTIVIAGKHGWLSQDIAYMLKKDASLKGKIIWHEEIDDSTLRWLYKECLFSVYPSHYEGWGLPVAEALDYGKLCIAARTSSIPEIAGDLIEYFSPNSPEELSGLIHDLAFTPGRLEQANTKAKKFKRHSWDDTYQQVAEFLGY